MKKKSAVVIFSGGQDSTTCLFWAKNNFNKVIALSFDYGQRHKIELLSAKKIAKIAKVKHTILKINEFNKLKASALLNNKLKINAKHLLNKNLPSTFVPGRNIVFIIFAAIYAYINKIENLVIGVSQVDYSGYPDCRKNFIKAIEKAISYGFEKKFKIHTPLINKTKKEIVLLAKKLKILDIMKYTHTCYSGKAKPCGKCAACKLRAKGFLQAKIKDPLKI